MAIAVSKLRKQIPGFTARCDFVHSNRRTRKSATLFLSVERRLRLAVSIAICLAILVALLAILWLCDGHLLYSLDDPIISLSLGWHIGHGHYGINWGETASPASSIAYPFILAAFSWTSWQEWAPFIVNSAAAIATGIAIAGAICRYGIVSKRSQITRGAVLVVAFCLAINSVGLVFVGLEHSLHALASIVVVLGLARALEDGKVSPVLVVAIVLLPLLRFEGAALALLAVVALALAGHTRAAIFTMSAATAAIAGYILAMHLIGLPPFPSSVLSKSGLLADVVDHRSGSLSLVNGVIRNASQSLFIPEALPVFFLIGVVVVHPIVRALRPSAPVGGRWTLWQEGLFCAVVSGALVAHVLFGAWGWFARYEAYAMALGVAGGIVLWHRTIAQLVAQPRIGPTALLVLGVLLLGSNYVSATIRTPAAARGIYEQQYQIRRFVVDFYHGPVAVNDLGWVSYRNPNYVLDVCGLGSEEARRVLAGIERDPESFGRLIQAKKIGLAIIFEQWFGKYIPPTWQKLAVLRTGNGPSLLFDDETFYATSAEAVPRALAALREFRHGVLPGTSLTIFEGTRAPPPKAAEPWPLGPCIVLPSQLP